MLLSVFYVFFCLVGYNDSAFRQERFSRSQNRVAQDVHVMSTSCRRRHFKTFRSGDRRAACSDRSHRKWLPYGAIRTSYEDKTWPAVRMSEHVRMSELILMRKNEISWKNEGKFHPKQVGSKSSKSSKRPWPTPRRPAGLPRNPGPHVVLTLSSRCLVVWLPSRVW